MPSYQTQYNTNTIEEPFGVIVGSLARDPSSHRYDVQKFHFENIETEKRYSLALTPMGGKQYRDRFDHFSTVEATGDVYQFQLPVGRYRFYNFYLNIKQPDGRRSWAAQEDYSIPFEVTANEVKYLGEIKQIPFFGSSFLGLRNYAGSTWVISNKFERDIGVLKAEFPNLSLDNMVVSVPDHEEIAAGLVFTPSEADSLTHDIEPFTEGVVDTFSAKEFRCRKLFDFTKNCNLFGGTKKIQINESKMRIAGSDDGHRVSVWKPKILTLSFLSAEKTFKEIEKVLSEKGIRVLSIKSIKSNNLMEGYILELDGDGYSILEGMGV